MKGILGSTRDLEVASLFSKFYSLIVPKRSSLTPLVLATAMSLSGLSTQIDTANASSGVRYTLKIPVDDFYREKGALKPPVKISASEAKFLIARTCKEYLGAKPKVITFLASGREINSTNLKPGYQFTSGNWIKDKNGENLFRLRGMCVYVAQITQRLPDSNFYSFTSYADSQGSMRTEFGYSYTKQQLLKMKNGITETRTGPAGYANFNPVPDIETPVVSILECGEGFLNSGEISSEETEETSGETVNVAYFGITNGVYRLVPNPGVHDPLVELIGGNPMYGDTWRVEYESPKLSDIAQTSEMLPVFATWKKPADAGYKIDLRISYFKDSETEKLLAKERKFEITIGANCKNATVVTR